MAKLEEVLRCTVKEKYLGLKGKNFKAKLQKALNLYVNDLVRFPDGSRGQLASLEIKAKDNEGGIVASYYQLTKEYDEKRLKQVPQDFYFNNAKFSITYIRTSRPEITQVDYNKYQGRSSAAGKASS